MVRGGGQLGRGFCRVADSGQALTLGISLTVVWIAGPFVFLALRARFWPGCPSFVTEIALAVLRSSPTGVLANLLGIVASGSPLEAAMRMIACELVGGSAIVAWAIWRLRPASRAAYEAEGQTARNRIVRSRRRRPPALPRPPCGDDPVLWYAMRRNRPTRAQWILQFDVNLVGIGFIAFATWRFAKPAFQELASRGYGAEASAVHLPDVNPFCGT